MRTLFWMILLIGAYVWVVTSGHEDFIKARALQLYEAVVDWFEDAEIDFQTNRSS